MKFSYTILLILFSLIIYMLYHHFPQKKKSKEVTLRIVIDGNDLRSFLQVMDILKCHAEGVRYDDSGDIVTMDVAIPREESNDIFEKISKISTVEVDYVLGVVWKEET